MKLLGRLFFAGSISLVCLVVFTCGSAPVRWYLKAESPLRVRVLDKTVPHLDYREHAALFWVLRHEKVATPQGSRDWDLRQDYVGYHPVANDGEQRGQGRQLQAEDLAATDLLYLADAYGVYTGDYDRKGQSALDYSKMIYGGLSDDEVGVMESFVDGGGHLVAEFNTFASPTGVRTRRRVERLLGVKWTGWTGRYFRDLSDAADVPVWARREWRNHYDQEWRFSGPGYLLVNEDTRLLVLRQSIDVERPGLTLQVKASDPLTEGLLSGIHFNYWFDIVTPQPSTQVLATFRFEVSDSGVALLEKFGLPAEFPAVMRASESPLRMYLAGDFSDAAGTLGPYWAEGLPALNKSMVQIWFPRGADQEPFYWGFYIPLLRNLVARYTP